MESNEVARDFMYKKTRAVPKPEKNIGMDISNVFVDDLIEAGLSSKLDTGAIESFSNVTRSRDQVYDLIDTMCEDAQIAAVLETYAEDTTEYNDEGRIVWVESQDKNVAKYVNYLLDTMNIEKNIYEWVYSLCKYGDLYLRLYRESDYEDSLFKNRVNKLEGEKQSLNEDINVRTYSKNDKYVHYIQAVNPAEMFELTKFGKTYGYIRANVGNSAKKVNNLETSWYQYAFKKKDVEIFDATDFVHASLADGSLRTPEEVSIFITDSLETANASDGYKYTVRSGRSLLSNVFKIWRQLQLLENSILLNRLTKSSIVRVIGIEIADMPKENVQAHLQSVKALVEQKSAINTGNSMSEYTNPGPIENNVYIPTRNGQGSLNVQNIGGDVDVKSLADLDYFKNKFWGALRVPKQYFGDTDDAAGFDAGSSLSIISSRYAKMIKRIQNTTTQALTDAVNLMLIDKGLSSYVNQFTIKMLAPTTREELDRRDNMSTRIGVVRDEMDLFSDIEDPATRLSILLSLISNVITNTEVLDALQSEIDRLADGAEVSPDDDMSDIDDEPMDFGGGPMIGGPASEEPSMPNFDTEGSETDFESEAGPSEPSGDLPSIADIGIDMTDNSGE